MHTIPYRVSVVIPVYRGELTLAQLLEEMKPFTKGWITPAGRAAVIDDILLVHDCGPDHSDAVIQQLAEENSHVRPIWLSRNFGQHAATLAGMASSLGDWVVTMDEDGQHDPRDIGILLDAALDQHLQLVYGQPRNPAPHGFLRNWFSKSAKNLAAFIHKNRQAGIFQSFRLVDGEIARNLAAYCGRGVYLDVGLLWVASRTGTAPITLRRGSQRPSGYSLLKLLSHFWTLILSSGPRPLRLISLLGLAAVSFALLLSIWVIIAQLTNNVPIQGWTTIIITIAFFSGCILSSLGVIAEYLALLVGISLGQPLYLTLSRPFSRSPHPTGVRR